MADSVEEFPPIEQCCLAISKSTISGVPASRSICFAGLLQSIPVQILVDSGSSSSFMNEALVPHLTAVVSVPVSSSILVVGRTQLTTLTVLLQVSWSIGDCSFQSDFRVLPLGSFDVVIGMDWSATYSPMKIHWQEKWMAIQYKGQLIVLQGLPTSFPQQLLLHIASTDAVEQADQDLQLLPVEL